MWDASEHQLARCPVYQGKGLQLAAAQARSRAVADMDCIIPAAPARQALHLLAADMTSSRAVLRRPEAAYS